jgi:hypothetical protein
MWLKSAIATPIAGTLGRATQCVAVVKRLIQYRSRYRAVITDSYWSAWRFIFTFPIQNDLCFMLPVSVREAFSREQSNAYSPEGRRNVIRDPEIA